MNEKHIIIIGGGIIGLTSAYYLNKKGFKVTILDNTEGSDNCSYGNAGFFSPSHFIPLASPGIISQGLKWMLRSDSPFYIKPRLDLDLINWGVKFYKSSTKSKAENAAPILYQLISSSRKLISELLSKENFNISLNEQGMVMYCKTQHALDEEIEVAEMARSFGQQVEVADRDKVKSINPDLDLEVVGGVYFKDDASITPHLFMQQLKTILTERGVNICFNVNIDRIETNHSGKIIKITAGREYFTADEYILAAGAWTGKLLKPLGINLSMQGGKGYSFILPNPKVMPRTCAILTEARVAVTPMQHGLRFAGTMEINGMDLNINKKRVEGIVNSIQNYFPQFGPEDFENIQPWVGLRPCSPDGMPYIGRSSKISNLLVASGHAMLGVSLAPITGVIMSQLISGETPDIDLGLLAVERFN